MMVHLSPVLQNNTSRFVSKISFSEDASSVYFFHLHSFRYTPNNALSLHVFFEGAISIAALFFPKIFAPLSQAIGRLCAVRRGIASRSGFGERKSATFECSFITPPISVDSAEKNIEKSNRMMQRKCAHSCFEFDHETGPHVTGKLFVFHTKK